MTSEEARGYLKDLMAVYSAAVVLTTGRVSVGASKMGHIMRELEEEVRYTRQCVKLLVEAEQRGEKPSKMAFLRFD